MNCFCDNRFAAMDGPHGVGDMWSDFWNAGAIAFNPPPPPRRRPGHFPPRKILLHPIQIPSPQQNYNRIFGVGDFDIGQVFGDLLGAGLKIGGAFAISELGLGGRQGGAGTQILPTGLPQQPAGTPPINVNVQSPAAAPLPTWVLPVAVGGGLLVLALVLKR